MKNILFICLAGLLSILTSCQEARPGWSGAEKEAAKKEISARIDEIIKASENLDVDAAMEVYWNGEEFRIISPDASASSYEDYKNTMKAFFGEMKSCSFETIDEEFRFLGRDQLLYTWYGNNTVVFNSGENLEIPSYTGTMLFEKIDGEWKIIYAHESAAQPDTSNSIQ